MDLTQDMQHCFPVMVCSVSTMAPAGLIQVTAAQPPPQNARLQASPQWEVTAGYVGCMRLVIPLTSLNAESCSLELDEALLTVEPRRPGSGGPASPGEESPGAPGTESSSPTAPLFDFEDGGLGPAAITDGVARIAGGIENILQRLRVQVYGLPEQERHQCWGTLSCRC